MDKLQNAICLNSRLYADLYEEGNDSLIAAFAMLKYYKKRKYAYKKAGYKKLRQLTGLSITTLKKHINTLNQMGLCAFKGGDFYLASNKQIQQKYKKRHHEKFVPIEIGNFKQTQLFSFRVRILKMEQKQKNTIDHKDGIIKLIAKRKARKYLTKSEVKALRNCRKKTDYSSVQPSTVLSNQGYYKLKTDEKNRKSQGFYWKQKLVGAGIIKTRRRNEKIKKCTQEDFKEYKQYNKKLYWYKGWIYKQLISEFTTTDFAPETEDILPTTKTASAMKVEPLSYLSFDMIAWWSNP